MYKKAIFEETNNNNYKKIYMEQGIRETNIDYVFELKQGLAKSGISFINGFISAIPWAIGIILIIILILFIKIL